MRAIVFNTYLETAGGGERSSFDYALALASLGYTVQMAVVQPFNDSFSDLKRRFGLPADNGLELLEFADEVELAQYMRAQQVELFVNHTFCSYMPNPAKYGIYVVMFPCETSADNMAAFSTYDVLSCISGFTQQYVRFRWGKELRTVVIPPPISQAHADISVRFSQKEPVILNVGRFNVFGHSKCQLEAIEAFLDLVERGVLDESWRLVVAGHVNRSLENERYVTRCRTAAQRGNVEVLTNISFEHLQYLYMRATCLWQFTGIHLPCGERPEYCEHLGLVAMDCFPYGVIPIVYERSGAGQLIEHGRTGFVFANLQELRSIMELLAAQRTQRVHLTLFDQLRSSAAQFSVGQFTGNISNLITPDCQL